MEETWQSLRDSIYQIDESLVGHSVDIFQTFEGGCTFVSSEFVTKLSEALSSDHPGASHVKFRFLCLIVRQIGFHFAKVHQGLAGSPQQQGFLTFGISLFGGMLKHSVIDANS